MEKTIYKVKCKHCGYEWWTKSNMMYLSCPNCGGKTENPHSPYRKRTKF